MHDMMISELSLTLPRTDTFINKWLHTWPHRSILEFEVIANAIKIKAVFCIDTFNNGNGDSLREFAISAYIRGANPCVNCYSCKCKNCKWMFRSRLRRLDSLRGIFWLPKYEDTKIVEAVQQELDRAIFELENVIHVVLLNNENYQLEELSERNARQEN